MIDGASRYRIFWSIVLPLSTPGLAATFILVLIMAWNEYLLALFLSSANSQTLPLLIAAQNATRGPQWWSMSVLIIVMIVPVVADGDRARAVHQPRPADRRGQGLAIQRVRCPLACNDLKAVLDGHPACPTVSRSAAHPSARPETKVAVEEALIACRRRATPRTCATTRPRSQARCRASRRTRSRSAARPGRSPSWPGSPKRFAPRPHDHQPRRQPGLDGAGAQAQCVGPFLGRGPDLGEALLVATGPRPHSFAAHLRAGLSARRGHRLQRRPSPTRTSSSVTTLKIQR